MTHKVDTRALKAAIWCLEKATSALEELGHRDEARRLADVCGVQAFTVGELLAVITLALYRGQTRPVADEIALKLAEFRRGQRVFAAKDKRKAA